MWPSHSSLLLYIISILLPYYRLINSCYNRCGDALCTSRVWAPMSKSQRSQKTSRGVGGRSRCRTRRVKCDETRPVSSACHRCDERCEYFDNLSRRGTSSLPRGHYNSPNQGCHSPVENLTLQISPESMERHKLKCGFYTTS
ncbi:hypothetical protein BJ875DRAFT_469940 [Amylocarpus encephaloides]|uniref:Zn(2)-C6 fungal-type domain-containing protein n=1 Tax=Amylocarpus encephaloides TaxID=45428 RepID=A0A9P7YCR8_9HELO|nr:hypothetical protein BJ875DRAFT_469940 [Amylocarpus encephaloides]